MSEPAPKRDEHGIPWCHNDCTICDADPLMISAFEGDICLPVLKADYAAATALRAAAEAVLALPDCKACWACKAAP
jgi:hypothetical protein